MELKKTENMVSHNQKSKSIHSLAFADKGDDVLDIEPQQIYFKDFQIEKEYSVEIIVRNKTSQIEKIKVYGPKQNVFDLHHDKKLTTLSSGLSKKIKVNFFSKKDCDYYDEIKIACEGKNYVIPIKATRGQLKLKYETLIEGGVIALNCKQKFKLSMKNHGEKSRVRIIKENQENMVISPDDFTINEGETQEVGFVVVPSVNGTYRHKILVEINDKMGEPINLIYSSTEFKLFLANDEGKAISDLDIGQCYYGQKKIVNVVVVNNTPENINIKSKIRLGWKFNESALQSPQELGIECSSTMIEVEPSNAEIPPFSKIPLTLVCIHPITHEIHTKAINFAKREDSSRRAYENSTQLLKMVDNEIHETLISEFGDKKVYCSLKATCVYPMVKIEPNTLFFGEVELKKTMCKKVKIKNVRDNLPIKVNFPKILSFEIIPNNVTIEPNSEQDFEIFLTPVSYGVFNSTITCMISNIYKIDLAVTYSIPSEIRADFKKQSASFHTSSHPILKELNVSSLLNNDTENKDRMKERLNRSQASFKIKKSQRASVHAFSMTKDNFGETSTDIMNSVKTANNFELKESVEELISGGNKIYKLPRSKDTLFVTRKIDKYEPYKNAANKFKTETREVGNQVRKFPKNRKEHLEVNRELPVEALKNVTVTEKILNFGKVFVHSKIIKEFEIINSNDFSIQIKLTPTHEFLSETETQSHILPAKARIKLKVVLFPKSCGEFESLIDYTINSVHSFKFLVQAEIELVTLNLSKFNLKLNYQDDVKDMLLSDSFELTNEGNTEASFSIEQNTEELTIEPKSGVLVSGQSIQISVTHNLNNCETIPAGEPKNIKDYNKPSSLNLDERLIIKVKNGVDMFLRVQSNTLEPKCYVKENKVNFGCCIVPKSKSKSFVIRNLGRSVCLFEIDYEGCENFLQFDCPKGKVLPESSKEIIVTYKSNIIHELNMIFRVIVRGGLIINVPFHAESVAPKISILESEFNFGEVCCGNSGCLPINIKNDSETTVELLLDLLNKNARGIEFLDFSFDSIDREDKLLLEKPSNQPMIHRIKVEAKSTLKFWLFFSPTASGLYEFEVPIYIDNFIKNDTITKTVTCFAKEPKFFLEPSIIKFKKKIINEKDNACFHPLVEFVTLKNPTDTMLKWKIELPKSEANKKLCFEIENRKGEVKAKSWQCINIAFNPYEEGTYCYKFPVLIYNNEKNEYVQEAEIKVEGEGQYPILLFDRRELILPVVPLQVESVGMFKIINEGYETIDIKHRIYSLDELMIIPDIILFYPEGSKMGINKKELYVIVKFMAKKPVSFTVKLEIYDGCRIYELPISGTSDNSIFTTFPYLSDKENAYKFEYLPETINLSCIDTRSIIDKIHNVYDQASEGDYHLPCEVIRRWINGILKDEKVIRFPEDLVKNNELFLKFLYKITNKKELERMNPEADTPEKFYEWVIRILKSMGCLLNHIRPYYLLKKADFESIFQTPILKHMSEVYIKYYGVMHLESWVILFYQVISNFWYNPQKIKAIEIKSNVYSATEILVLKWIRQIYMQYNENDERKFMDLNKDFKDCYAPIYALYHYNFGNKNQLLDGLSRHTIASGEIGTNVRMLYSMMGKANLIPLVSEDEYHQIKEKEVYMLLYQLYESLPQQLPKTAPILFTCELGEKCTKYIEIKNPSNKYVNYWVRLEGSQDYFPDYKEFIRIEPKTTFKLAIEFRSRVSQEEIAFLVLFNKKEADNSSGMGCSLVFELRSQIIGRKSIKKLESLRCPMYESTSIKIPVENTFNDKEFGHFKITLSEELIENKESPKVYNFCLETETIKIRRNTSNFIDVTYSPMILKSVKCYIIFCDPAVGEFQYEITGIPEVPKPLQEIKVQNTVYINNQETIELSLPVYNNFLIKSLSNMEQKWESFRAVNRTSDRPMEFVSVGDEEKEELNFKVEVNMDPKILQFIKFPSELTVYHRKKTKTDLRNKLKIECNFNVIIKDLTLDFVLLSADKRDVRRFKAQVTVASQPIESNLIMRTNARTPLVQEIPFENTSSKDWKINCILADMETSEFSLKENEECLQKDYVCKRGGSVSSYIVYNPDWISETSCKLKITNVITNEQVIYCIQGIAEEPLSEDHLYFSTFTGRSDIQTITIKNPYPEKLIFYVSTDLSEIEYSPEIILEAYEKINFNIITSAGNPGVFIGYLKFMDKIGRYFWYSVTIEATDQIVYEENIRFETLLDKEIEKVLEFKNPQSKSVSYKVDFDCEYLLGEKYFDIKPYSSFLYRLKFKPTKILSEVTNIRIFCPEKGAHIYKVEMHSHEHYKRQLPPLKVEVGRIGFREIKLSENGEKKSDFTYETSNSNFYVESPEIGGNFVKIFYKPTTEGSEKCTVKAISSYGSTKMYEIEGIGIAPFTVETVEFETVDLSPKLEIIKFRNPFNKNSSVEGSEIFSCYIERNDEKEFRFVGYGEKWESKISDVLAIPVEFKPKKEGTFESMLTVQTENYKWQYLLKGSCLSEAIKNNYDEEVKCKTREEAIKVLNMEIPEFLKQEGLRPNRIEVLHPDPKILSLIKSWLKLKIEMNSNKEDSKSTLYLRFKPKKPINEVVTLSLFNNIQESIKINRKVKLVSESPEFDEKIGIEINSIKPHVFNIPIKMEATEVKEVKSRLEKGEEFESRIVDNKVELKFTPSNCTFKNNIYSDLLIIESEEEFHSFKIEVKLKNKITMNVKKKVEGNQK